MDFKKNQRCTPPYIKCITLTSQEPYFLNQVKGENAQGATTRATSDKIVTCRSRCRLKIWVYAQSPCVRACVRQIGMAAYILEYDIIFIRI